MPPEPRGQGLDDLSDHWNMREERRPVPVPNRGGADQPRVERESEAAARGMQGAERALLELLEADLRDGASEGIRAVLRIAGATASAQCFDDVIELVAEETLVALRAASVSISRWERDRGVLRTLINVGEMEAAEERFPSDEVHPLAGYGHVEDLVLRGRPYRTAINGRGDEGVAIDPPPGEGAQPELGVPIRYESAMWGELWVRGGARRRFDEPDVRLLQAIAAQVASAIGRTELFERVSRWAFEDPLTGLANRRRLEECLDELLAVDGGDGEVVVVICDVDGLKQVNDSVGHAAGDELLRSIGALLSVAASAYPEALVARLGGDEFCVLLPRQAPATAAELAKAVLRAVSEELERPTTLSWGATARAGRRLDRSTLLREADAAQYAAKRLGGGRFKLLSDTEPDAPRAHEPAARRARDERAEHDLIAGVLARLDAASPTTALSALEVVADELCRTLDAAAWSLSLADPELVSVRTVRGFESELDRGSGLRLMAPVDDERYLLADYPQTARVVSDGGGFTVDVEAPGQDPAEIAVLRELGYQRLLAAGTATTEGRYLLELYGDHKSRSFDWALPAARLLTAYCAQATWSRRSPR
jgi:diguanylate cyclase (GGDEF)-like protein